MLTRYLRNFFFLVTGNPGYRFRKSDKPSENSFRQLFDSIGFLKEKSDTATTTTQGFSKLASDTNSINRDTTPDSDGFEKTVQPHQLPNVLSVGGGIMISTANNATGRTGGTGKDFYVKNTLLIGAALTPGNPIIVTQTGPGEDVEIDFDQSILQTCKVATNALDPTCDYLDTKIESSTPLRLIVAPNGTNTKVDLKVKDKVREVTMYSGTFAQFTADFPGNQGVGAWVNWVLMDGGIYNDSLGNPVTVGDMRGSFPVGFDPVAYPNIGSNQDAALLSGAANVTLTAAQSGLVGHTHGHTGLSINPAGNHNHNYGTSIHGVAAGNDYLGSNGVDLAATSIEPVHIHTLAGTIDAVASAPASASHENRPPFRVMVFVTYIG